MKGRSRVFFSGLAVALGCALALSIFGARDAQARAVRDATGAQVELAERPARVVTLAPSLGELAADLLGEELGRIVGISEYTDYPPALAKVASIGPYHRFSLEKVAALKPDLVLATLDGNERDQVLRLRELGLRVVVVSTSSLKEVEDSMLLVADALGLRPRGERMAAQFRQGIARFRERAKARKSVRVLLQIDDQPLVTIGRQSFLTEALAAVGGTNIYGDLLARYPRASLEDVVSRNPEAIVILGLGNDLRHFHAMAARWAQFPNLIAVKEKAVRVLQGDTIVRPTLRLLEGLALLERAVHGAK